MGAMNLTQSPGYTALWDCIGVFIEGWWAETSEIFTKWPILLPTFEQGGPEDSTYMILEVQMTQSPQ